MTAPLLYPVNNLGRCVFHKRRHRPGLGCPKWNALSINERWAWVNEHGEGPLLLNYPTLPASIECDECGEEHVTTPDDLRFDDLLGQAAWAVANHGFVEQESWLEDDGGDWQGLVLVSSAVLLNLHEMALHQAVRCVIGEGEHLVWLRQSEETGFIHTEASAQVDAEPEQVRDIEQGWAGLFEHVGG